MGNIYLSNSQTNTMSLELDVEIEFEVEIEIEVEVPQVEVEFEVEVEVECPDVEVEVEFGAEIEIEIELPDVEVGMNVEVDLSAPISGEVGGNVHNSKFAQVGAAKLGGMAPFCAFLAWFTFMMGIVVCSIFSYTATANPNESALWGWITAAMLLLSSACGMLFCYFSKGKARASSDVNIEVSA